MEQVCAILGEFLSSRGSLFTTCLHTGDGDS